MTAMTTALQFRQCGRRSNAPSPALSACRNPSPDPPGHRSKQGVVLGYHLAADPVRGTFFSGKRPRMSGAVRLSAPKSTRRRLGVGFTPFPRTYDRLDLDPRCLILHADNGGPMKGSTMLATLKCLGVGATFSRPNVAEIVLKAARSTCSRQATRLTTVDG